MTDVNGTINGKPVTFEANETILSVARRHGYSIPTLCEMQEIDHAPGTCRVCLVEMKRAGESERIVVTSCTTPMEEGMEVCTRTPRVRRMQRLQVELLLADHDQDCAACVRHGDCELQDAAQAVGLRETRYHYPEFFNRRTRDNSSPSIERDMSKCIRCMRCVTVCREIQGTDVLVVNENALETEIQAHDDLPLGESGCVGCGQCILVCPVGALAGTFNSETVVDMLSDPDLVTVFQFAPALRVALGEEFGLPPGTNVEGQIVSALRALGADVVLDTNFTADLVIMEEGTELLHRARTGGVLPMFTSCCPGWVDFAEKNYPGILPHLSSVKSPQQAFGAIAKTFLAERMDIDPARMRVISIMPCTAKKAEAGRVGIAEDGTPEVDVVISTRELARLLKREGIPLAELEPSTFDNIWMGSYSGAGAIFGTTGGVMEAAVRSAHYLVNGSEIEGIEMKAVRGMENQRAAEVSLGGDIGTLRVGIAHGLRAARQMVEDVLAGKSDYQFIEIMACPGGCMGGGGQPRIKKAYQTTWKARREALFAIDQNATVRQSHNNPMIKKLYEDFLGEPMSDIAHHLLHTRYRPRPVKVTHSIAKIWKDIRS